MHQPLTAVAFLAISSITLAQFTPTSQERTLATEAQTSGGGFDSDSAGISDFGPFTQTITSAAIGNADASAQATALQNSSFSSTLFNGMLGASTAVSTGTTLVNAEASGSSSLRLFFSIPTPTFVSFVGDCSVTLVDRNPSRVADLTGIAFAVLINYDTMSPVAACDIINFGGSASVNFNDVLPAGNYLLWSTASAFAFSPDPLGQPSQSAFAIASTSFTLTAVPASSPLGVLGVGCVVACRRRRAP